MFLWKVVEQTQLPCPSVPESGGTAGAVPAILAPYVAIWVYLRAWKKLGLGDIVGIMTKLCVISHYAPL